jgi:lysozyme family protein
MARNYKEEYEKYHGTEKYKKDRASRNKVRRKAIRDGKVRKHSKMDIDHKDGNPRNNSMSNLRIVHRSVNRAKH